jgi:hypothetical protein
MAREFICPHCCTTYRGIVSLGDVVTCEACCESFPVLPFFGDQNGLLRMMGGRLFEAVVGQKYPNCGVRDAAHIRAVDGPQRVIGGRWHDVWRSYYLCRRCNATWYYAEALEA